MKAVSIILWLKDKEKYVEECLNRIFNQSLKDIEIICVMNKSMSDYLEMLKKFKNLKIIYKENKSVSELKNRAIDIAKGKYIYFMDSDVLLTLHMAEELWTICEEKELDILYFSGTLFFEKEELEKAYRVCAESHYRKGLYENVMTGREMFLALQENDDYTPLLELQFIRKAFLEKERIRFKENIVAEDNIFNIQCVLSAKRAFCVNDILYYRRLGYNSPIINSKEIEDENVYFKSLLSQAETVKIKKRVEIQQELKNIIERQHKELKNYECQIENIKRSNSYRVGRFITYPIRILKRICNHRGK